MFFNFLQVSRYTSIPDTCALQDAYELRGRAETAEAEAAALQAALAGQELQAFQLRDQLAAAAAAEAQLRQALEQSSAAAAARGIDLERRLREAEEGGKVAAAAQAEQAAALQAAAEAAIRKELRAAQVREQQGFELEGAL